MVATLVPARLELREDGTPFSRAYGDIYHSESGGLGQAEHVFLRGNDLPRRWAGRSLFSILETGFGLGINFLATWAQWRRDVEACTRLHYVSIEKHPFSKIDLQNYLTSVLRLLQVSGHTSDTPSLANEFPFLVDALCAAWPPLVTGMHRIEFEQGRVVLTLIFGDALEVLPTLTMRADAFYLDGFSPAKNPDLWSTPVFKSLTRLAALGASVATYTVSAVVRQSLQDAGFRIDREPGYDSKRDMLIGRFVPRFRMRRYEPPAPFAEQFSNASKHVMVVGAGLAGCAVVATMAARGWHVTLIEAQAAAAMAASGNPAGVFHPMITRDDSFAARLSRSGFLHALRAWHSLQARGLQFELHDQGLFVAAQNAEDFAQMQIAHAALRLPDDYVRLLTPDAALSLIGVAPVHGGWYFPQGGWLDPAALCRAQLAAAGTHLTAHYNTLAHRIERQGGNWQVLDQDRHVIACAPILVIANAHDAGRLTSLQHLPTISIRGQLTQLPATQYSHPMQALQQPLIGDGYVIPLGSRGWLTGASYDFDDTDATLRQDSQQENLQRLRTLLPQAAAMLDSSDAAPPLAGRTAFRCVASDRMPLIGAVADEEAALAHAADLNGAHLADVPRQPGLYAAFGYGSRGLVWAALGAELVASQIEGEPLPVDKKLADGVDPARFLLRVLRHSPG
jgi:tRNA 5-methylaminomethyl-2-thiouridine biosynthesis bifunctional protein